MIFLDFNNLIPKRVESDVLLSNSPKQAGNHAIFSQCL